MNEPNVFVEMELNFTMEMSSIIVRSSQYRHISDTGLCVIPNLGWMVERDNCPGERL